GKDIVERVASIAALAACAIMLISSARGEAIFAAACGLATLGALVATRRFGIGSWGYSAIAALALVVAVAIIAIRFDVRRADPTLGFAAGAPRALVGVTQRIAADVPWMGTGAGTFATLVPIYRDIDDTIADSVAPTAAAAVAVELGRPMLVVIVIAVLA